MNQSLLQQFDVCEHRYPSAVVVPQGKTFVLASWCMKCSDVTFAKFIDEEDESDVNMEEL